MKKKMLLAFSPGYSRCYFLFLFFFLITVGVYAQTVKGTVNDENGKKLAAVTVSVKGGSAGTTTDASGNYSIAAASNAVLLFSFVGFTSQEISVNGRSSIDVTLISDVQNLGE